MPVRTTPVVSPSGLHQRSVIPARIAGDRTVGAAGGALLVVAIVVLALNMRGPIAAVSPVLDVIRTDLGIGAGTAGLLTSLPVLCFGLATPLAALLLARAGLERGVLIALVGLVAGIGVRSAGGLPSAIVGTLIIGAAITIGNVAVPMVIGRNIRPGHAGMVLGSYTAALNVGSMITLSLTVPIAGHLGWRGALAAWGALAVVAAVVWWIGTRRVAPAPPVAYNGEQPGPAWRRPVVWALTAAFAGHAFAYYGMTAWLPQLLREELGIDAATAGVGSSVFQIAAVLGAFGVPVVLRGLPGPRPVVLMVCAAWTVLPLGLLLSPQDYLVWCTIGGAAQGGGITVAFSLIVHQARGLTESRQISALTQGGGYLIGAAGPTVVGTVRDLTGAWTWPLLIVLGAVAILTIGGSLAAGPRPPVTTRGPGRSRGRHRRPGRAWARHGPATAADGSMTGAAR